MVSILFKIIFKINKNIIKFENIYYHYLYIKCQKLKDI